MHDNPKLLKEAITINIILLTKDSKASLFLLSSKVKLFPYFNKFKQNASKYKIKITKIMYEIIKATATTD